MICSNNASKEVNEDFSGAISLKLSIMIRQEYDLKSSSQLRCKIKFCAEVFFLVFAVVSLWHETALHSQIDIV